MKSQNTKRSWHPFPGRLSVAAQRRQWRRKTVSECIGSVRIDLARAPQFGIVSTVAAAASASASAEALIRAITIAGPNLHKFPTLAEQLDRISDVATEAKFWPMRVGRGLAVVPFGGK